MKNKMRILAMVCAGLLVVGCDNQSKTDEKATNEAVMPAAPAEQTAPTGTPSAEAGSQAVIDAAQGVPAELSTTTSELSAGKSATMTVPVEVKNTSQVSFMAAKDLTNTDAEINFSVSYLDSTGQPVENMDTTVPLPDTLGAGQSGTFQLPVMAPSAIGQYTLQINLVQEGKNFQDIGVKPVTVPVSVK